MFYDHFGEGSSLYELGEAVSGTEDIEKLAGTITVAVFEKLAPIQQDGKNRSSAH